MYESHINKMTLHFSSLGSITFCKACDNEGLYPITKNDVMIYYDILNSENVTLPQNISKSNQIQCCLYYLTKYDESYKQVFLDKFIKTININKLEQNEENLISIFNNIIYDKTYLHSQNDCLIFLYSALSKFHKYPTSLGNWITYLYLDAYIRYKLGKIEKTKEKLEKIKEEINQENYKDFYVKYIKLKADLLYIKIYEHSNDVYDKEYKAFVQSLYNEIKNIQNKEIIIKIGLKLFSFYTNERRYKEACTLIEDIKNIFKNSLLKGYKIKNSYHYNMLIASRIGYLGMLLGDEKKINTAIKKLKKTLNIIKSEQSKDEKFKQLIIDYEFLLSILEIGLNKQTDYDIKNTAFAFQKLFLENVKNKKFSFFVTNENKNSLIVNLKIINNMNQDIEEFSKNLIYFCIKELEKNSLNYNIFFVFIGVCHDKVYNYAQSYISDKNEEKKKIYAKKIMEYYQGAMKYVNKFCDNEDLINTPYVQSMIMDIFSSYAHILLTNSNLTELKKELKDFDELIKKIKIDNNLPSMALIYKIKGDYWLLQKDYKGAIFYLEKAIDLFEKGNQKYPATLCNLGYAYYLNGQKDKAIKYLNLCLTENNKFLSRKNIFGYTPNVTEIVNKVNAIGKLISHLY